MALVLEQGGLAGVSIRREPLAGDPEGIGALHGAVYGYEYALDALALRVEIASELTSLCERGFPAAHEGLWVVSQHGRVAGSLALIDEGERLGRLRFFMVAPELRGLGLGRSLVEELIALARSSGAYDRLYLTTFDELEGAAVLYRDAGFALVGSCLQPLWGRRVTTQRYELAL